MSNCKLCRADCVHRGEDRQKGSCKGFLQMTNADRIRAMSDEALANFLCGLFECGDCPYEDQCKTEILREWADGWLNWLRQPAEKDNND